MYSEDIRWFLFSNGSNTNRGDMDKYQIKELIGDFLEDMDCQDSSKALLIKALRGQIETNDGLQRYYVDLDTLLLDHIDLSEAIWSIGENDTYRGDESNIVYFDALENRGELQKRILDLAQGEEKWRCLESKILNKLSWTLSI